MTSKKFSKLLAAHLDLYRLDWSALLLGFVQFLFFFAPREMFRLIMYKHFLSYTLWEKSSSALYFICWMNNRAPHFSTEYLANKMTNGIVYIVVPAIFTPKRRHGMMAFLTALFADSQEMSAASVAALLGMFQFYFFHQFSNIFLQAAEIQDGV